MNRGAKSFYELSERAFALERQGKKIIRLNVGNTALPVPEEAVAALHAVQKGKSCGYLPAAGARSLLELLAEREQCTPEQIVVGPGSKFLIYSLLKILHRAGSELLTPAPYWPAYPLIAADLGI